MGVHTVKADHINKSFGGVKALADVSFDLKTGEAHALQNENGAGKSTLMKIFSDINTKESGDGVTGVGFDTGASVPALIDEDALLRTVAQAPKRWLTKKHESRLHRPVGRHAGQH